MKWKKESGDDKAVHDAKIELLESQTEAWNGDAVE
jgi:hypothetical protein